LVVGLVLLEDSVANPIFLNTAVLGLILGGLNLILAILTRSGGGVEVRTNPADPVKLVVDKAAMATTIYLMAFSDKRLVLKRLSSGKITVGAVLILFIVGLVLGGLIGALMGGGTAISLQEFATQKKREAVKNGNLLDASGKGDLEIPYSELEKVELTRSRVRLHMKDRLVRIVVSRRYPMKMQPVLQNLIGSFSAEKV